jgi:O-acetyl-ADP-ribose deacetylase (regulator of RNase III)
MKYINQDITKVTEGVLCHGVNTRGAMGAGVALYLRNKYPKVFHEYVNYIETLNVPHVELLGRTNFVYVEPTLIVANCFTQTLGDVYPPARVGAISESITTAYKCARHQKLPLYMVKIGCGLGGLDWENDIEPIMSSIAGSFPEVDTYVCVYP